MHFPLVIMQSSTSGVFKTLGDQARRNPDRLFLDAPSIFKKLEMGRYAFPFVCIVLLSKKNLLEIISRMCCAAAYMLSNL